MTAFRIRTNIDKALLYSVPNKNAPTPSINFILSLNLFSVVFDEWCIYSGCPIHWTDYSTVPVPDSTSWSMNENPLLHLSLSLVKDFRYSSWHISTSSPFLRISLVWILLISLYFRYPSRVERPASHLIAHACISTQRSMCLKKDI